MRSWPVLGDGHARDRRRRALRSLAGFPVGIVEHPICPSRLELWLRREVWIMSGSRRKPGPLGPFVEGYRAWLLERGYSTSVVIGSLGTLGHLGRWMERDALAVDQLSDETVSAFLAEYRGDRSHLPSSSVWPLLEYLRAQGAVSPDPPRTVTPVEQVVDEYRGWLLGERGLATSTVRGSAAARVPLALSFVRFDFELFHGAGDGLLAPPMKISGSAPAWLGRQRCAANCPSRNPRRRPSDPAPVISTEAGSSGCLARIASQACSSAATSPLPRSAGGDSSI